MSKEQTSSVQYGAMPMCQSYQTHLRDSLWIRKDGILEPLWTDGDIGPQPLECALEQVAVESESEEEKGF